MSHSPAVPKNERFLPKNVGVAASPLAEGQGKVLVGLEGIWDWEQPQ